MLDYEITPYKTEIIIAYADQDVIGNIYYIKVLDFHYAKAAQFSIDVPDVPIMPQLPSKYTITVMIADDPNKPEFHACSYAIFENPPSYWGGQLYRLFIFVDTPNKFILINMGTAHNINGHIVHLLLQLPTFCPLDIAISQFISI
ncbi:hypothetical protein C1646_756259 [Rhizophagus diaphanus]|nr:hypothetical protein C1646_756259 [Rhizophagus diaphanus] [Rhizophagus sp. MUCL 43196]